MESALHAVQPDALAAAADLVDGTLNNQSLVVLFTCKGKKLLFVGDAQWGNWAYWLYGKAREGQGSGNLRARARDSRVDRLLQGRTSRQHECDADSGCRCDVGDLRRYVLDRNRLSRARSVPTADIKKKTEVPRIALMEALEQQTDSKLVRSDWIAAGKSNANPEAHEQLETLPPNFSTGELYVDYVFPD